MAPTKIALLHQAQLPPVVNGISKPMKPGGYKDGCADIGFALSKLPHKWTVIAPALSPSPEVDADWSFPDTVEGIERAIKEGATVLWANTTLFAGHPITKYNNIKIVGPDTEKMQLYDDKDFTNRLFAKKGLSFPATFLISETKEEENMEEKVVSLEGLNEEIFEKFGVEFPAIVKPIRGRGSQGVNKVDSYSALVAKVKEMFATKLYGNKIMVEEFLPGDEFTVAVFPPYTCTINGKLEKKEKCWAAPAVIRINHQNGVAPYNGLVAVTKNSFVWQEGQRGSTTRADAVDAMLRECEVVAQAIEIRTPMRIDCRVNKHGKGILFDINIKPNLTGAGRPGRDDQDSLVGIAVSGIGWSYVDLVDNMAAYCCEH